MSETRTLEERVERIEALIDRLMILARKHPMGKMFLRMMGE